MYERIKSSNVLF